MKLKNLNMKIIMISKHIHSCLASASSTDVWFQFFIKEPELDFIIEKNATITSKKYRFLNGENIEEIRGDSKFTAIYLTSDKTYYNKGGGVRSEWRNTDEFKAHIGNYVINGWRNEENEEYALYRLREEKREEKKSKKDGLVLWMSYDNLKKQPLTVYQGGFSDEVFNTKGIQEYISDHCVHGWIGHSGARRKEHDWLIEKGLRERGLKPEQMYNWISSGDGRHFADSLEGYSLKEQLAKINQYLNHIYNCCLIYADNKHEGTMKSSNEIRVKLQKKGVLLPY